MENWPKFFKLIKYNELDSTNSEAKRLAFNDNLNKCIFSKTQTRGKGSRGRHWISGSKNLAASFLYYPKGNFINFLHRTFIVSLAVFDALKYAGVDDKDLILKWPNDVLVERRKIAGVLIESQWKGNNLFSSIIGVGLNVNQTHFEYGFDATSMKLLSANDYDLKEVLRVLCTKLNFNFNRLLSKEYSDLQQDYLSSLYKYNEKTHFKIGDKLEEVVLKDVNENGMVSLEMLGGKIKEYDFSQARQII